MGRRLAACQREQQPYRDCRRGERKVGPVCGRCCFFTAEDVLTGGQWLIQTGRPGCWWSVCVHGVEEPSEVAVTRRDECWSGATFVRQEKRDNTLCTR